MKMTTTIAFDNMKYHRSRNILIGIAIVLTTFLLFVIPTVGKGTIDGQFAAINQIYPTWHALFREVDKDTVAKLAAHHDIAVWGLRSDAGEMALEEATVSLVSLDETAAGLYRIELADGDIANGNPFNEDIPGGNLLNGKILHGKIPMEEDEIVISRGILSALGQQGEIGDTITVPYQIIRDGGLDFVQEREFRICGFLEDSDAGMDQRTPIAQARQSFMALVSEAFIESEIPADQITYRFLFQINGAKNSTTDEMKAKIENIAKQFGIAESDTSINTDMLMANYVDVDVLIGIVLIMLVVIFAGVITVYGIYYVSMHQRIQEFGRLKAIGATKRQVKQIVLREGFCVAALAIPAGLLLGTLVSRFVLLALIGATSEGNDYTRVLGEIIRNREIPLYHWWIYLLAAGVTLCAVWLSLVKPMKMAAKISEIDAMRFHDTDKKQKSVKKGFEYLTIGRLTRRNLAGNKKKSVITITSMAATGVLLMVVATVLSCANPTESANASIVGQYEIFPAIEENNREHPERQWISVQQDNPLNEELRKQIESLDGVIRVDSFTGVRVTGKPFAEYNTISGIPEEYAEEIEQGIIEGSVTYEELKSGDKVVLDSILLYWYPELKVGSRLNLTIYDGERSYEKEVEVAAIGEYDPGLTNYHALIMAKEAADRLCENNSTYYFHVIADQDYDPALAEALEEIVESSGRLEMNTWQAWYNEWESGMTLTSGASYAFLGILAAISVMNLINTMINSVHVRRKELGMMQAIGMSHRQLMKMLQMEGLFYTLGALAISIGVGSLAGYPLFLYAKHAGMFQITTYHYPWAAAVTVSVVLLLVQTALALMIAQSVKREPVIERIRFSE
ncbi:MAG: ABC transporter permease [Blautia sp.]|nr:ABC transporter permease [Blautia sp.]